MKNSKSVIPQKMREEMKDDPDYSACALFGQEGHLCGGRITREHAIIAKGNKVQEKWAIIPLCARGHAVDEFQDAGTMNKEQNEWVALSRASDADILKIFGETSYTPLGKAERLRRRKEYLIGKYGVYHRIWPQPQPIQPASQTVEKTKKQFWYPVNEKQKEIVAKAIKFHREKEDVFYTPFQMIERMIIEYGEQLELLEEENRI